MWTNRLPLTALRAFEVTGRHLSVKKAAEDLYLTPGAVSQQIRLLEAKLDVELFVRAHRRLTLTSDGRHLFFALRDSFSQIERALSNIARESATPKLRLKLLPTFAIRWFIPRLAGFLGKHPEIEVEITTTSRADDASLDDVDFALRTGLGDWKDVEFDRLFGEEWVPVCAPSLARALRRPADVLGQTRLHSMMRPYAWSDWLKGAGLDSTSGSSQRFSNSALALQAAIDGLGVAIVQRAYLEPDVASGRLVVPFKATVKTSLSFYLVSSRKKAHQPKIKQFRAWLRTVAD